MTPIPITRAEYEKKFGVKPVVASTSILEDEKPAPIRITRAEWEALQKEWNPPAQTYAQDAKSDIAETKRAVLDTAQRGADKLSGISNRVSSGETSKGMGAFQKFGRALITTGNMVFDTGIGVAKAVLPQKVEDSVKKFFEGFGNEITEYNKDFYEKKVLPDLQSTDPNKRDAAKLIVETLDAYKNDANFRDTADAAGGIVSALFSTKIKDGASNTLDTAIGTSKKTISTANDVISPIKKKVDERGVNNVIKEIDKIENKYVKTRNANTYSKDIEASQRRIAQSNVLDGAVDTDGVIRTKTPGGVIDQYRAQTIDGLEDIVRKGLKESKETIPVTMVRQALVREVGKSGLEGADLVTALKKIDKELEGLNIRTKGSSIVDLSYLHDNKIATTKNINYLTPPEKSTYRKAVARAYKMLVEENSTKVDVKGINKELSMYLDDIKRLERLDGARAEGGRLGKYTASVAGTLIGGAAGSVGGGVGAAVGGIIGGEAAAALKGLGMSRTFKGGGKGLPKSAVLERARLSIPDKAIKAKAGVPKTKEITKLEKDIAKNVADQKKAIKKGDFALVAALKEVYAVLVEELKKAIKYLNENGSVGMSIKKSVTPESVAKRADDADMGVLDYVIRDYDNAILDPNVNRTLSDMGLGKATRDERIRFAKDVFDEQVGVASRSVVGTKAGTSGGFDGQSAPKKYKTTVNLQDKNDLEYLEQIFSRDTIEDIKAGKTTNWRGESYEDLAHVNFVSEKPLTVAQKLEGKISDVKLKSNTFYHGTSAENAQGIMTSGFKVGSSLPKDTFRGGGYGKMQNSISLAETPKEASIFSQLTRDGEIVEAKLKDNAKVVSIKGVEDAIDLEDYISYLKKEKVDAVYIGGGEKELVVINTKAVIPTKSQLTDIWKKANRKGGATDK